MTIPKPGDIEDWIEDLQPDCDHAVQCLCSMIRKDFRRDDILPLVEYIEEHFSDYSGANRSRMRSSQN